MALTEYRICRNGNGKYKIQEKGTLWGWNDVKEYISYYDGGDWTTKYFNSHDSACKWYIDRCLAIKLHKETIKQSKQWKVDNRRCSSTLTSRAQSG